MIHAPDKTPLPLYVLVLLSNIVALLGSIYYLEMHVCVCVCVFDFDFEFDISLNSPQISVAKVALLSIILILCTINKHWSS